MATPFSNVGTDTCDDYDFYHSQLCINIECSFGYLVNRWRVLLQPFAATISIQRVNATVMLLCRLHNFCIDKSNNKTINIPCPLYQDPRSILGLDNRNDIQPVALLSGGEHFEDCATIREKDQTMHRNTTSITLPCDSIHKYIADYGFTRPTTR